MALILHRVCRHAMRDRRGRVRSRPVRERRRVHRHDQRVQVLVPSRVFRTTVPNQHRRLREQPVQARWYMSRLDSRLPVRVFAGIYGFQL